MPLKIRKLRPLALTLAVLWSGSSETDEVSGEELFGLWADCYPVSLAISLGDEAKKLLGNTVETLIRSRLRAARLFSDEESFMEPTLTVFVGFIPENKAFAIQFKLRKFAVNGIWPTGQVSPEGLGNNFMGMATTWADGRFGAGEREYILSGVSELTDQFIDEYLRVNADACGS